MGESTFRNSSGILNSGPGGRRPFALPRSAVHTFIDMSAVTQELAISEIFESIQGEGPRVGVPSVFLRLAHCNLRCTFCDTPYTWDFKRFDRREEVHEVSLVEVAERIRAMHAKNLVVTGGEPLIQRDALERLLADLSEYTAEIETAGTLLPGDALAARVDRFNVSPKLASSGNPEHRRIVPQVLGWFRDEPRAVFKFVVCGEDDLHEIDALVSRFEIPPARVMLMPEGRDAETLAARGRWMVPRCVERGYRYGHRLHVVLFGDTRAT
jgi:7-carboxy-7-deazaguanine synthase